MTRRVAAITIGSGEEAARAARGACVVIDVFRAFTTAAVALDQGAERIVMVGDLDHALTLRRQGLGRYCMGERGGDRPQGFDFGNSPVDIAGCDFSGETLIQSTSNGTRGILAASGASALYAGALVTASATARAVAAEDVDAVWLLAMGANEVRADEDEICALCLRALLAGRQPDRRTIREAVLSLSRHADGHRITLAELDLCLDMDRYGFAVRVRLEGDLCVARRLDIE